VLARLSKEAFVRRQSVSAPADDDAKLQELIARLRQQGERVVVDLTDQSPLAEDVRQLGCDRRIVKLQGQWELQSIK